MGALGLAPRDARAVHRRWNGGGSALGHWRLPIYDAPTRMGDRAVYLQSPLPIPPAPFFPRRQPLSGSMVL